MRRVAQRGPVTIVEGAQAYLHEAPNRRFLQLALADQLSEAAHDCLAVVRLEPFDPHQTAVALLVHIAEGELPCRAIDRATARDHAAEDVFRLTVDVPTC